MICDYGCGQEANFLMTNGKWCCRESFNSCPNMIKRNKENNIGRKHNELTKEKISKSNKGKNKGRIPWNRGVKYQDNLRKKFIDKNKLTIEKIVERYHFFSTIEEMRYNPDKPHKKEIQVHCKNHLCKNSKEQGGWFTPTGVQLYERIRQLEKDYGNGGCYLYCSDECKNICPLFNVITTISPKSEDKKSYYTAAEYQTFRNLVLERDKYICQFCGDKATDVHHERPQKLEPFFSLDPDYAWSCCEKCHYGKGHQDDCNTGNLTKIECK